MCRYTYHHYPVCGHIANFTVAGCPDFTNQLRAAANTGQNLSCDDIKSFHDLLPASQPSACAECERDWRQALATDSQENMWPMTNIAIEGLNATGPILQFAGRMTLDVSNSQPSTTEDTESMDGEMCDVFLDIAREQTIPRGLRRVRANPVVVQGMNSFARSNGTSESASYTAGAGLLTPSRTTREVNHPSFNLVSIEDMLSNWEKQIESSEQPWTHHGQVPYVFPSFIPSESSEGTSSPAPLPAQNMPATFLDSVYNWMNQIDSACEPAALEEEVNNDARPGLAVRSRIDLLDELPSRGELITDLCQALKSTPPASDWTNLTSSSPENSLPLQGKSASPAAGSARSSGASNTLWRADMSNASSRESSVPRQTYGDGYDWLPSRQMDEIPRLSEMLWTMPLESERWGLQLETEDADDEHSHQSSSNESPTFNLPRRYQEALNYPVTDQTATPHNSTEDVPRPGARRRLMGAMSENEARANGPHYPPRNGGLYLGF